MSWPYLLSAIVRDNQTGQLSTEVCLNVQESEEQAREEFVALMADELDVTILSLNSAALPEDQVHAIASCLSEPN